MQPFSAHIKKKTVIEQNYIMLHLLNFLQVMEVHI